MIAIQDSPSGFHPRWIAYCEQQGIPFRRVDCYSSDIIQQLNGCQALMWHYGQSHPKDILIARQILFALEHAGLKVFPDFRTAWHFDDKVAQKYLFEALGIQAIPAYVFVDREQALEWISGTDFPKVFKLRRGAGSAGVKLVKNEGVARKYVKKAFRQGFPVYDPWGSLKERIYKWRQGKFPMMEVCKGVARFAIPPVFSRILGRERGYVYFQDFIPNNQSDVRVFVVGDRACALTRFTRPNDFRASGSGLLDYDPANINPDLIRAGFDISKKLDSDAVAMDFITDDDGSPLLIEISYGSPVEFYDKCVGYWDPELNWKAGTVDPHGWMVSLVLKRIAVGQVELR